MSKSKVNLTTFELVVLSIIKGTYLYKDVPISKVLPVSDLDIKIITGKSIDEVTDVIVKLICHDLVYCTGDHIYGVNDEKS